MLRIRGIRAAAVTLAFLASVAAIPHEASAQVEEWDPIEPVNRGLFSFNDTFDRYLLEPAARGWRFVIRPAGTRAVQRFMVNLEFPIRFVGSLLQANFLGAGEEVGRFAVNTTVGLVGFFDPASKLGIGFNAEDVGQAFGFWGIPPGPYLMVPFLGPSDGRDFVGGFIDSAMLGPIAIVRTTLGSLNSRALLIEDVEEARLASLDYYTFVRNVYLTQRQALVENRKPEESVPKPEDLYQLDEDLDQIEEQ